MCKDIKPIRRHTLEEGLFSSTEYWWREYNLVYEFFGFESLVFLRNRVVLLCLWRERHG
jgi:hypothetical protein